MKDETVLLNFHSTDAHALHLSHLSLAFPEALARSAGVVKEFGCTSLRIPDCDHEIMCIRIF